MLKLDDVAYLLTDELVAHVILHGWGILGAVARGGGYGRIRIRGTDA